MQRDQNALDGNVSLLHAGLLVSIELATNDCGGGVVICGHRAGKYSASSRAVLSGSRNLQLARTLFGTGTFRSGRDDVSADGDYDCLADGQNFCNGPAPTGRDVIAQCIALRSQSTDSASPNGAK